MLTEERHQEILSILERREAVTVTELAEHLHTSESTIRRDLTALQKQGKLNKVFGGATSLSRSDGVREDAISYRETVMSAEKDRIARYAATLIRDDDFIFIDAGSTTSRLVDHIENRQAVYVTNGVVHALKMMQKGLQTHLIGGKIKPLTESVVGVGAAKGLAAFNFTKAFLGTNGIDMQAGFTTPDPEEALIKEAAVDKSYVTFVLADHTKFRRITPVTFAPLRRCCILTDRLPGGNFTKETIVKVVEE